MRFLPIQKNNQELPGYSLRLPWQASGDFVGSVSLPQSQAADGLAVVPELREND
jgi:hypothetical protein